MLQLINILLIYVFILDTPQRGNWTKGEESLYLFELLGIWRNYKVLYVCYLLLPKGWVINHLFYSRFTCHLLNRKDVVNFLLYHLPKPLQLALVQTLSCNFVCLNVIAANQLIFLRSRSDRFFKFSSKFVP